ncbi:MAG: 23S rRNA (adenine(2503)-C(2))-methyltransferase RlmN [bacterium]
MTEKIDLRRLDLPDLRRLVLSRNLPEYRYRQIARWLYDKAVDSLDEMTDLSRELRDELSHEWAVGSLETVACQRSRVDASSKWLFRLPGGGSVEAVLMPTEKRVTLCISSQVGCTLDCVFCQTGKMGFLRNLEAHEIVAQVIPLWKEIRDRRGRTNVVFMGMGEPLHNVDAVMRACRLLVDPLGLDFSPKRITVSTAGALPGIRKLAESGLGVRLAVSLNAPTQELRERLMPRAARTPLADLIRAARQYAERAGDRVTLEYVLMRGVNDSMEDADRLARLTHRGPFKLNIIPYNPGASPELERPEVERVDAFATRLHALAPVVTVRWSMGPDISAACGQLRTEVEARRGNETGGAAADPSRAAEV